jgi:hypothetical protein
MKVGAGACLLSTSARCVDLADAANIYSHATDTVAGDCGWFELFSDLCAGIYSCPALATDQRQYFVDTVSGVCTCHCFSHHAYCPHVLAAVMLSIMPETLLTDQADEESSQQRLITTRRQRLQRVEGSEEPFGATAVELEKLQRLRATPSRQHLPAEVRQAAATCDKLKGLVKQLPAAGAMVVDAQLNELVKEVQGMQLHYNPTTVAANKQERRRQMRLPGARVQQPLNPSRRRASSQADQQQHEPEQTQEQQGGETMGNMEEDEPNVADNEQFQVRQGVGRPRTTLRGLDGMLRNSKSGGKRQKR